MIVYVKSSNLQWKLSKSPDVYDKLQFQVWRDELVGRA